MKRLVIKLGTGILSKDQGRALDRAQFARLASEFSSLLQGGTSVVVVSSGAVAAGVPVLGLIDRPADLAAKQACAAVGQPALMSLYDECLRLHGLRVGQLLLSHADIDSRMRRGNARNTLDCLLGAEGIVPIVNENDSVGTEELRFGDNDRLSAEVAVLVGADMLVILTSVDGLLDADGNLIPDVDHLDAAMSHVREETGRFSVGGMRTKLEAVRIAADAGIPTIIANGRSPGILPSIVAGEKAGTFFQIT
jgi:glutamate 5-kinase